MSWTKPARAALLFAAVSAALAGCAGGKTAPSGAVAQIPDAATPLDQYGITVSPRPEELALGLHAYGLSVAQRDALSTFAGRWREGAAEGVTISSPVASDCRCDPRAMARAVASALTALGVPADRLRLADYDAGGRPDAPVVARYTRYEAKTADCRDRWSNLSSSFDNKATAHFGCAMAQNIAVQVADPRDFLRPVPVTPADGGRRDVVLDLYRKGSLTSSAKDDQAAGAISNVVH